MNYDDQTENNGKLKPEVKTEWLTRLRSGDVAQTAGALRRLLAMPENSEDSEQKFGYCCLGVLSDIYVGEKSVVDSLVRWDVSNLDQASGTSSCTLFTGNGDSDGMPTGDVNEWAFATGGSNGWYVYIDEADAKKYDRYLTGVNGDSIYLPQMNDSGGRFEEIADLIEKYL